MHELGVVLNVVKKVEEIVRQNNLQTVDTLVLQIGELSSMIPRYVESCYPAAVDGTLLQDTKLRIETVPAVVRCRSCGMTFNGVENEKSCPRCRGSEGDIQSGREFLIKEILAC